VPLEIGFWSETCIFPEVRAADGILGPHTRPADHHCAKSAGESARFSGTGLAGPWVSGRLAVRRTRGGRADVGRNDDRTADKVDRLVVQLEDVGNPVIE
jgi:hypothetical protein